MLLLQRYLLSKLQLLSLRCRLLLRSSRKRNSLLLLLRLFPLLLLLLQQQLSSSSGLLLLPLLLGSKLLRVLLRRNSLRQLQVLRLLLLVLLLLLCSSCNILRLLLSLHLLQLLGERLRVHRLKQVCRVLQARVHLRRLLPRYRCRRAFTRITRVVILRYESRTIRRIRRLKCGLFDRRHLLQRDHLFRRSRRRVCLDN